MEGGGQSLARRERRRVSGKPPPKAPPIPLRLCVRNYEVRRMISGLGGVDFEESVLL